MRVTLQEMRKAVTRAFDEDPWCRMAEDYRGRHSSVHSSGRARLSWGKPGISPIENWMVLRES